MDYQVWTHDEYSGWSKIDCGDLLAARREILEALKQGQEPLLTVAVPYDVSIKVQEDKIGETTPHKAKQHKDSRGQGDREVRPGDEGVTETVGEGSGDHQPDSGPENRQ